MTPIFEKIARINQYDPRQDYLQQVKQTLQYRSAQEEASRDRLYSLALACVLQQDVENAILALKQLVELDPGNAYVYAYLSFIYLYDWRPHAAQVLLETARQLNPDSLELKQLSAIAALMGGNPIKAWNYFRSF
ncbi:MAG: hypothetical protein HC890_16425 [Chloroflexaceae bacterium]|nr:hypothetical protein [Chloroflexaceae bacterium]